MEIELASDAYKITSASTLRRLLNLRSVVEVQSILSSGRVGFGLVLGAKETPYSGFYLDKYIALFHIT